MLYKVVSFFLRFPFFIQLAFGQKPLRVFGFLSLLCLAAQQMRGLYSFCCAVCNTNLRLYNGLFTTREIEERRKNVSLGFFVDRQGQKEQADSDRNRALNNTNKQCKSIV